jgi:hypothetical protein
MIAPPLDTLGSMFVSPILAWSSADGPLGWLFINPLKLPAGARMWLLLPLVACVAVVYRATRARTVREMPRNTVVTFVNIVVGMVLIAVAFYLVHAAARHWL